MPQYWEEQGADNEYTGEDEDVPEDCNQKRRRD